VRCSFLVCKEVTPNGGEHSVWFVVWELQLSNMHSAVWLI
jgi:hypothetical protein